MIENGALSKEDFGEKVEFEMANKELIDGYMAKIDNVIIGDFKVNNVPIAILENGSLLCGMSFIDKSKKWEIDNDNQVLTLCK